MDSETYRIIAEDGGHGGLQLVMEVGPARFVVDQPFAVGGLDLGPGPHDLVCAGLAACTAQTLRLYAKRKNWPLGRMTVEVSHHRDLTATPPDVFARVIAMGGPLDEPQRTHLLEIAERCPVHLMLTRGASVTTAGAALD